jgi:hypothetical protein
MPAKTRRARTPTREKKTKKKRARGTRTWKSLLSLPSARFERMLRKIDGATT